MNANTTESGHHNSANEAVLSKESIAKLNLRQLSSLIKAKYPDLLPIVIEEKIKSLAGEPGEAVYNGKNFFQQHYNGTADAGGYLFDTAGQLTSDSVINVDQSAQYEEACADRIRTRILSEHPDFFTKEEGQPAASAVAEEQVQQPIAETRGATVEAASSASIESYLEEPRVAETIKKVEVELAADQPDIGRISNVLYEMLTKRRAAAEMSQDKLAEYFENTKTQREWYRSAMDQVENALTARGINVSTNPSWFSATASERVPGKPKGHFKVYETLPSDKYATIIQTFPDLVTRLQKIGQETGERISIKTPGVLLGLVTHNDSLVAHCDNPETQPRIYAEIQAWKQEHGIGSEPREFGRTNFAADTDTESFSQLVARKMALWAVPHKGRFSLDVIARETAKHAISLSQVPPKMTR